MDTSTLLSQLKQQEEKLLAADPADLKQLLADDLVEIGSSGRRYGKADIVAAFPAGRAHSVSASNFAIKQLSPNTVLLLYRTRRDSDPPVHSLRSSIWQRSETVCGTYCFTKAQSHQPGLSPNIHSSRSRFASRPDLGVERPLLGRKRPGAGDQPVGLLIKIYRPD